MRIQISLIKRLPKGKTMAQHEMESYYIESYCIDCLLIANLENKLHKPLVTQQS